MSDRRKEPNERDGERLQRFLARTGALPSRRKAEDAIRAGRVRLDGRPATLGERVQPGSEVRLDGTIVRPAQRTPTVLLLHKPRGVLSSSSDDRGRRTVMDLVPALPGLHPVGRLDFDSEGLLLLTDDGDLTMRLTHPRYRHEKVYRVTSARGRLSDALAARLRRGVTLEDGPARALRATPLPDGCEIVLAEGRKRQVRRMMNAVGHEVERLVRTEFSGVRLGDLPAGQHRPATLQELKRLGYDAAAARAAAKGRTR